VWLAIYAVGAVGVALLLLALTQVKRFGWIGKLPLGGRLGQIAPQFLLGTGAPDRAWLKVAGLLALLLAIALLVLRADRREQRGALMAGALAAAGFVLSLLLIVAGTDEVITRNLIVVLISLILLFAGGLGASRAGLLGLAGAATLCAIGVIATSAVAVDGNLQRPHWRDLAHVLSADHPPGAASAILEENSFGFAGEYIPGLYPMRSGASVREFDVVAVVKTPSVRLCWWGAECSLAVTRLDTSIQIPGFRPHGPVVRVQEFAIYRLRATTPAFLTQAEIARAARNARLTSYGVLVQPPA
jgi:hypothetical protein